MGDSVMLLTRPSKVTIRETEPSSPGPVCDNLLIEKMYNHLSDVPGST